MDDSKQLELSLKTLCATIFLGVAGDLLLRDVPWGIGFALYGFVIAAIGAYLYRHRSGEFGKGVLWLVPPALLFASLFAWRDSGALKLLNGTCLALIVGVFALRVRTGNLTVATLVDYPCRLVERWFGFVGDFVSLLKLEGLGKHLGQRDISKQVSSVLRGVLIAAPILFIFGGLFASSDAVFSHFLSKAFSFDTSQIFSHVFVTGICLWLTGGFLRRAYLAKEAPERLGPHPASASLGITEIAIVLGTLNSLFLAFVAIQFRYLFGGSSLVQRTAHLSYADYAHQGFFELLVVAILGLGVLIGAHSLVKRHESSDWRTFASLAFTLVTLIFVVMASAATRMQIYVAAYGITEERVYAMAILLWLTLVFCWFCASTLRRRENRFAPGALASFLLVVFGLNCINPDATIVRLNTARAAGKIDGAYLGDLSDDVVPALIYALPKMSPDSRAKLIDNLKARKSKMERDDWRSWSLSEMNASEALSHATF